MEEDKIHWEGRSDQELLQPVSLHVRDRWSRRRTILGERHWSPSSRMFLIILHGALLNVVHSTTNETISNNRRVGNQLLKLLTDVPHLGSANINCSLLWKSAVHRSAVRSNASSKFLQNYAGRRVRQPRTPNTSAARVVANLIKLDHWHVKKTVSSSTPTCWRRTPSFRSRRNTISHRETQTQQTQKQNKTTKQGRCVPSVGLSNVKLSNTAAPVH